MAKPKFAYHNYVDTLSKRFNSYFESIKTEHNFEYGTEFEVALSRVFMDALPEKFGITRGYAVNYEGESAGDDIIIYDRSRFPKLALREKHDLSSKEYIPIESIYCYIEAKHTLILDGSENNRQSLNFACNQISKVKGLCLQRPPVPPNQIGTHTNLGDTKFTGPKHYPDTRNPMFTAIFCRQVRCKNNKAIIQNPEDIEVILREIGTINQEHKPDIIVLGKNVVILPVVVDENGDSEFASPFFIEGLSDFRICRSENLAFGVGLLSIMGALDWIQLGVMPWLRVIANGVNMLERSSE